MKKRAFGKEEQLALLGLFLFAVLSGAVFLTNSTATIGGFAVKKPDYSVESVTVSGSPVEMTSFVATAKVSYSGSGKAPRSVVRFNVSGTYTDLEIPSTGSNRGSTAYPKITAEGNVYKVEILSPRLRKGRHFVSVSADAAKKVSESNENNNYAVKYFDVKEK